MKIRGSQRLRVVSNGVSFFTNAKQVRDGVGDNSKFNMAADTALYALEAAGTESIAGVFADIQIQIDLWGDHAIKFSQVGKSVY